MQSINWSVSPFPYAVIDNFLPIDEFEALKYELDKTNNLIQSNFKTPLESKSIYKNTYCKESAQKLIERMGSNEIKEIISQQTGDSNIITMGENISFAGYSPYHITNDKGFLGAHIDHSCIEKGHLRHIANTIFYASTKWDKGWGGQTILFSRNGLVEKVLIEPIPNRLIVFIHTAYSFHGVRPYSSSEKIQRRTFYHDYYVEEKDIIRVIEHLNKNRKSKLIHTFHSTTFIPFFPFGIDKIKFRIIFNIKNINYIPTYIIYLLNRIFGTSILSFRDSFKNFIRRFTRK